MEVLSPEGPGLWSHDPNHQPDFSLGKMLCNQNFCAQMSHKAQVQVQTLFKWLKGIRSQETKWLGLKEISAKP